MSLLRAAALAVCSTLLSAPSALSQPAPDAPPEPPAETAQEGEAAAAPPVPAPEEAPGEAPTLETRVTARPPYTAASATTVRERDLRLQVLRRPADLLQVVPGLFTIQHAGGGKANQYFLRGFDADHGTDVALFVDGVPVNLVSHGHGQGYADLNWLIPELVERVEVTKGPYAAHVGDFATAGAVNLVTRRHFERSEVTLTGGAFDTFRALVVAAPRVEGWSPLVAAQAYTTNGPFEQPEALQRYNVFARVARPLAEGATLSLALTSYSSDWSASGQLPQREVEAGRMSPFGSVDPTEGGNAQRHGLQAVFRALTAGSDEVELMLYATQSRLGLFSNFSYYSRDPENGDQVEQDDARTHLGLSAHYRFRRTLAGVSFETTLGTRLRTDHVDTAVWAARARERLAPLIDAEVREGSTGLWVQEDVTLTPWLRAVLGLRADSFGFEVRDRQEDLSTLATQTSGVRQATLLSPKASLVVSALPGAALYLNYGHGFHSNDARGVVRRPDPVTPLTRARGYEVGVRARPLTGTEVAAALFRLDLDSELVWVGDDGTTEPRGPTRRQGLEVEVRSRLLPWLHADADLALTRATFVQNAGNGDAVALAPTLLLSGGLSVLHPTGTFGRLGAVHVGDRPATEDRFLTARGFTRLDASAGYRTDWYEVNVGVQNLLNTPWREAQFASVSRLPGETSPDSCPTGTRPAGDTGAFEGCEDLHFTPGAPLNAQATVRFSF